MGGLSRVLGEELSAGTDNVDPMTGIRKSSMAGLAVACFLLSGCSGASTPEATTTPAATVTKTVTATVEASPTPAEGPLQLGDTSIYDWGNVTVLEVDQSIPPPDYEVPGVMTWTGVLVRTCVTAKKDDKPVTLGWSAWTVSDKDGGQYNTFQWSGFYDREPQPSYPMDRAMPVGQCAKGWIIFNKPAKVRPVSVTYGPSEDDPVLWSFQ